MFTWDLPDAALATIDNDSTLIGGATIQLDHTLTGPNRVTVAVPLDLGTLGSTTVFVPLPVSTLRALLVAEAHS